MRRRIALLAAVLAAVAVSGDVPPKDDAPPMEDAPAQPVSVQATLTAAVQATEQELQQLEDPGERAELLGRLAMLHHAQDMLGPAETAYRRALAERPHWRWHYLLAVALADQGATRSAIAAHRDALALAAPDHWLGHYRLGLLLLLEGNHAAATQALNEARAIVPKSAAVLAALGDAAVAREDFETARELFREAASLAPNAGRIAYKLALVHRRLGNIEAAERWLTKRNPYAAPVDDPLLLEVAELSLSPKFFIKAGERAWERGERDDALAAWRNAASLAPHDADAGLVYAHALGMMGHRDASLAEVRRVLAQHPESPRAWYLLAHALRDTEHVDEALEAARTSLQLADDTPARALLAALLMRSTHFKEAATHYQALAARQPNAPYYAYWLGLANLGAQSCPAALRPLRRALDQEPTWGQAHIALTRAQALCGTPEEQRQALAKAQQLVAAQNSADTRLTLAFAQLGLGRLASARDAAKAELPHPDAAMLIDAIDRGEPPSVPFAPDVDWWLPSELR